MKAWRCSDSIDIADLELVDTPIPKNADMLTIKVHAAAINFSDILMVQNRYQIKPPRPFTPGQEVAGTVTYAPQNSGFSIGDRVATKVDTGGFAEFCTASVNKPIRIPDTLDFATAAALPVSYTTALVALTECCHVKKASSVLVLAASGAVGLASIELAKALGATVIAAASTAAKRELATAHGADHAVDYAGPDWVSDVKTLTLGQGVDTIVDPVGGDIGEQSLRALARDGTILIVGFASGAIQNLPANRLLLKRASAKGVYWNHDLDPEMMQRCNDRMHQMLVSGNFTPQVAVYTGLNELPKALDDLKARRSVGKLVLDLSGRKDAL